MTEKELRKLRRVDLLEMLTVQIRENESLQDQVRELIDQLNDRKIMMSNAGSIAEAAIQVNGVFQAAQAAGDQYLENLVRLEEQKKAEYEKMRREAETEYQQMRQQIETECREMREKTEYECRQLRQKTETECRQLKEDTETECLELRQETKKKCEDVFQMVRKMIEENI
ncbi:MAG: hypothetical protein SOW08_10545 [Lachnospiraceae bacterium]|nr:hypothetical protein [Lachnospiraceae bacterium]